MKFNELTDDDIAKAKRIYFNESLSWDEKMKALMDFFEKSERSVRYWLTKLGIKKTKEPVSEQYEEAKKRELNPNKRRFLITWAQNNTVPHYNFFNNMKAYAEHINADIHVIAGRYKNPTSIHTDEKFDIWHDKFLPYLDANRHNVHKSLRIMSDVKIQPTAVNPMSGLVGMSGTDSCIFGHPKVHFEVVPALEGYKPKKMWTTGACTVKNYTDSKAGKKGEFHHTLGFLIIEIEDNEKFHVRQVTANNNGDFTDLFYKVKNEEINIVKNIEAMILGDIHLGDTDPIIEKTTIKLLERLKPKHTIIHDLFDGYSISHHHEKDPILKYIKTKEGKHSLKKEIDYMKEWLEKMRKYNLVIVRSNHDDFVDRWIARGDWKKDMENAREYIEYSAILMDNLAPKGIIPYIIDKDFKDIKTLNRDESFIVKKWELGVHGDIGANGSRGSINGYRKLNTKMITGHSHSPARKDGALVVGTSTKLRLNYNIGPSNWAHSHVIIHEDGKSQHINILIDDKNGGTFTTFDF